MKQETEVDQRCARKQQRMKIHDVLGELRHIGRGHFVRSVPRSSIEDGKKAELALPTQFVEDYGHKFEAWVTLRTWLSQVTSSRPWTVGLRIGDIVASVCFAYGWHLFVVGNHLEEGDTLVFLLKEKIWSEFVVYTFRGFQGSLHFPDAELVNAIPETTEEDLEFYSAAREFDTPSHSLGAPEVDVNLALLPNLRHANPGATLPQSKPLQQRRPYPSFRKRLTPACIKGSGGAGAFFFLWSFIKTHRNQLHGSIRLQGVHEASATSLITCRRNPRDTLRVNFLPSEWGTFVKENGLRSGHELEFSLVAESYFVVRMV